MNTRLYDLAYKFRNSKIWKAVYEDEIFAVPLEDGEIGYCMVMGRGGEHRALSVYFGTRGLSTLRLIKTFGPLLDNLTYTQDCVQCCLETKDMFDQDNLYEIEGYCRLAKIQFRSPYPQFMRYEPRYYPRVVDDEYDFNALETALAVVAKIAEMIRKRGAKVAKNEIGLCPVAFDICGETYYEDREWFDELEPNPELTIPLYSVVDGELHTARVSLPTFEEPLAKRPDRFDDDAIARIMKHKQSGVFECEARRTERLLVGEPPHMPTLFFIAGKKRKNRPIAPLVLHEAEYDPNAFLRNFVKKLEAEKIYPTKIKTRTAETWNLLEEFCQRAKIKLVVSNEMACVDEQFDELFDKHPEGTSMFEEFIELIRSLSIEQIRNFPPEIRDDARKIAENPELADFIPDDVETKLMLAGI